MGVQPQHLGGQRALGQLPQGLLPPDKELGVRGQGRVPGGCAWKEFWVGESLVGEGGSWRAGGQPEASSAEGHRL